jgi:hypothetical protein
MIEPLAVGHAGAAVGGIEVEQMIGETGARHAPALAGEKEIAHPPEQEGQRQSRKASASARPDSARATTLPLSGTSQPRTTIAQKPPCNQSWGRRRTVAGSEAKRRAAR